MHSPSQGLPATLPVAGRETQAHTLDSNPGTPGQVLKLHSNTLLATVSLVFFLASLSPGCLLTLLELSGSLQVSSLPATRRASAEFLSLYSHPSAQAKYHSYFYLAQDHPPPGFLLALDPLLLAPNFRSPPQPVAHRRKLPDTSPLGLLISFCAVP